MLLGDLEEFFLSGVRKCSPGGSDVINFDKGGGNE
jgi:hypothetical protein